MLVLRVIATIVMSISCFTAAMKNNLAWEDKMEQLIATMWGLVWRGFIIAAIWMI